MTVRSSAAAAAVVLLAAVAAPSAAVADPVPVPAIAQYVEAIPTSEGGALPGAKPRVLRLPDSVARKVTEQAGPDAAALAEIATSSAYGAPQAPLPRRAKEEADTRRPDDGEPPQRVALPRGPSIAAPETDAGVRLIGLLAVLVALTAAVTVGAIRARA